MTEQNAMTTQFWLVWNVDGNAPRYKHTSEYSALLEAERLAGKNPGQKFVVLEATHMRVVDLMQRVDLRDPSNTEIPF